MFVGGLPPDIDQGEFSAKCRVTSQITANWPFRPTSVSVAKRCSSIHAVVLGGIIGVTNSQKHACAMHLQHGAYRNSGFNS